MFCLLKNLALLLLKNYNLVRWKNGHLTVLYFHNEQVQVIIKWTGHTDYKTMKPCIDATDSIKACKINKFNIIKNEKHKR